MKRLTILLICVFAVAYSGLASVPFSGPGLDTPGPPYPPEALASKVTGSGVCQVVFDPEGHAVSAVMIRSTGAKILDANTVTFARKNWTGRPNTNVTVPVEYQLTPSVTRKRSVVKITGNKPPYPAEARRAHSQGSGIVKVSFDKSGKVVSATMSKSTGSETLDQNTIKYVTETWRIAIGRESTMFVPITYRLW